MSDKYIYIKSYGCQMNVYDSNRIKDLFSNKGYKITKDISKADLTVLNTCHIREKAVEKVYSDIGRVKKIKDKKQNMKLVVAGCVAQAEGLEIKKRSPSVDYVVGPQSYHKLPDMIDKVDEIENSEFLQNEKFKNLIFNSSNLSSEFLSIQEGCDMFCSFCVVPYTRGPEFSSPVDDIVEETKKYVSNGIKEIILLGQNVNAYHGIASDGKSKDLAYLINKIGEIEEIKRIRYMTSHPIDMKDSLIKAHADNSKLMPFLHLPVQSGSDKILKSMNRKHTIEQYLDSIDKLKKINPEIKFSSDFIVGYPGESEKDFNDTISLIKKVNFINSFSFIYSPRPGTPASRMKMLDIKIQKKRLIILQNLLEKIQIKKNYDKIKKVEEVLVENRLKNQTQYFGRTRDLTPVILNNISDDDIGNIIKVRIDKCDKKSLFGRKYSKEREVAA